MRIFIQKKLTWCRSKISSYYRIVDGKIRGLMLEARYRCFCLLCKRRIASLSGECRLGLLTIAYNNPWVIALQILCIKKFVNTPHCHIVFDNSSDAAASDRIQRICKKAGGMYVAVPAPLKALANAENGSTSHGIALNFAVSTMTRSGQFEYIGLLDHDIYPTAQTSPLHYFRGPVVAAGLFQRRDEKTYLWPGFSFFRTSLFVSKQADFRPGLSMDTGGRLYYSHYKNMERNAIHEISQRYEKLRDDGTHQSSYVEIMDNWVHSVNASYWSPCSPKEEDILRYMTQKTGWHSLREEIASLLC